MYSVPQNQQLIIFLCSLGMGFLLGVLYDILRAIRLTITKSKVAVVIFDIIYFILFGTLTFLFIIAMNKGEVRAYMIIGELIGAVFYYFSFGIAAIKITDVIVAFVRKLFRLMIKGVCFPFRVLSRLFSTIFHKIWNFCKNLIKKFKKFRKKHLPKLHIYVYNLFGILSVRRNQSKKGGKGFEQRNKSNKKEEGSPL